MRHGDILVECLGIRAHEWVRLRWVSTQLRRNAVLSLLTQLFDTGVTQEVFEDQEWVVEVRAVPGTDGIQWIPTLIRPREGQLQNEDSGVLGPSDSGVQFGESSGLLGEGDSGVLGPLGFRCPVWGEFRGLGTQCSQGSCNCRFGGSFRRGSRFVR